MVNQIFKKFTGAIFSVLLIFSLTSCSLDQVNLHGIDKYSREDSTVTTTTYLLPFEKRTDRPEIFFNKYQYLAGDYYYFDNGIFVRRFLDRALMYLTYDKETYEEVKSFSLNMYPLSLKNRFTYNGYEFIETLALPKQYGYLNENNENRQFPYHFNFVSYNDEKNTMVYIGFCLGGATERDKEILSFSDVGAFLKEYFSMYDFDN